MPFTVTVPPAADAPAVILTLPLLLPLAGETVYPVEAVTVQATFEVILIVVEAPPAKVTEVGLTLKDSVVGGSGVGVGEGLLLSPLPSQEAAAKEIIPDTTAIAQSLCSLKNLLIILSVLVYFSLQ